LITARLQLKSVKAVYHASSMTPLTSMDELQDIEDLVVEGEEEGVSSVLGAAGSKSIGVGGIARTALAPMAPVASAETMESSRRFDGEDGSSSDKYKKRSSIIVQAVQSCAPSWTSVVPESLRGGGKEDAKKKDDDRLDQMEGGRSSGLPPRKTGDLKSEKKKKHRSSDPRVTALALSVLSCVATMVLLYTRLAAKLPPP